MSEKNGEFPTYEGIIHRVNATESRIRFIDQQLSTLKGLHNYFKRRNLEKKKREDMEFIKKLTDQTPTLSVEDAIKDASQQLSDTNSVKNSNE